MPVNDLPITLDSSYSHHPISHFNLELGATLVLLSEGLVLTSVRKGRAEMGTLC